MRMVWIGQLGYPTTETRDQVFAAFGAQAGQHMDHLTPSTWTDIYPDLPAGLTSGLMVDGLPGFSFCYDIDPPAWSNSDEWLALAEMAQEPSEGGGQQINQIPE